MGKVLNDFGAALSSTLVPVGQKLRLYKAMAGAGWMMPVPFFVGGGFYRVTETPFNRIFEAQP